MRPEKLIMRESYHSNGPTSPPLMSNRHQYLSDDFASSPSAAQDESNQVDEDCDYSELLMEVASKNDNAAPLVVLKSSRVTDRENYNGL